MAPEAVIFDMDGVISDTQVLHAKTESRLLRGFGISLEPEEITRRYAGIANKDMFPDVFRRAGREMPDVRMLIERKWSAIEEEARRGIREVPGTRERIERLRERGIPMAVGSASCLSFIYLVLRELGFADAFDAVASAEEVTKGKPEPDVFLLAAARISADPSRCVVIEDGRSGMVAAGRAGMRCIGLVRNREAEAYPADIIVSDLREAAVDGFLGLERQGILEA